MDNLPKSLLIVDDEDMIRATLEAYFQSLGCTVYGAASGEEALEILADHSPEAAIVDMRLPGLSGQDTLLAVHARRPDMGLLIYTGSLEYHPSEELLAKGLTSSQVFIKPVEDMRVLADALAGLMAAKTAKQGESR